MKTVFTLLLATIFTSAFARNEGKLTISIVSQKNFTVYVDGRILRDEDNSYVLNRVQPGHHTIQVYRQGRNGGQGNNRNRRHQDRRGQLVYSTTINIRPSYHVDILINRFGKAMVDERSLDERNDGWYEDDNDGYENDYKSPMSDHDFNQLLQRIRNQWFGRLGTTRDAINENYFFTSQVRQILQLFTTESERLELAKLSYGRLVDARNFRQLYDLFSTNGQAELDRYVREVRY